MLRHTFATFAIAASSLFELSRLMGTSVEQIDRTYGHLLPDSLDRARTALDGRARRLPPLRGRTSARPTARYPAAARYS